jgi:PAS domain-containing protein
MLDSSAAERRAENGGPMSDPRIEPAQFIKLRHEAEKKLKAGTAPTTLGWSLGVNALGLIHKLASSPASAADALKLLHEVQVHQVELDLQHEQIETTQRELGEDLAYYRELYDCGPVGYVTLGPRHDILDCNLAAASLFDAPREDLRDRDFPGLLAPASRPALLQMLKRLRPDTASAHCQAQFVTRDQRRDLQIVARLSPSGRTLVVVMLDLPKGG